ncbi:GNAT family N-acetyltransferase [Nonomuraea sp. NPDC049725]|uniref:GNAT family N-acetyltransferase n=1 Tax=Nonomuraea sp. NPDC049725 TaxID=3154508 RepID=UPI0034270717
MWAAQRLEGGARAWALGDAVVAAAPAISRRDRLVVWAGPGPASVGSASSVTAVRLVRFALAELGPSYRPLGERELVSRVVAELDEVEVSGAFSWMSLPGGPVPYDDAGGPEVGWLGGAAEGEVAALLAGHAPDSYAVPGAAGVRRWAGVRIGGELAAVAADAWSAPSVGLLAGVATVASRRGLGLAERVCRWVSRELVAGHGRAALMVDDDNAAALSVYGRIGYVRRPVLAAQVAA